MRKKLKLKEKKQNNSRKRTFEECIDEINQEIFKKKNKWNLNAINWMDFQDVAQIIRFHIYKKWHLYQPKKPLAPWVNTIVNNQIKNLIRNHYGHFSRPCLKCLACQGESGCAIYGEQCNSCPLYARWEKTKKNAHDTKLTLSIENHSTEINDLKEENLNLEKTAEKIHIKMQQVLKPVEWKIYQYLYIQGKTEEHTAKLMGYRTSEKNRTAGYKQIRNLKKSILIKVKKYLYNGDIDIS
jgi:DNA-directed RNA polymerase specialized sigma24 family protein